MFFYSAQHACIFYACLGLRKLPFKLYPQKQCRMKLLFKIYMLLIKLCLLKVFYYLSTTLSVYKLII